MSGIKDLMSGSSSDDGSNANEEQSKSLIANTYSNDGTSDPESYKKLDDWGLSAEEIRLAYLVTKGSGSGTQGLVRMAAKSLSQSGSHEEWYSQLQVALAHYVGSIQQVTLPNGDEPEGADRLMEMFGFDEEEILSYIADKPDVARPIYEQLEQVDWDEEEESDEEPVEADD